MWENETSYRLALKKNLIYEHCQEVYKQSQNFDVIFVTSDNYEVAAHKIILVLSSEFLRKTLVNETSDPVHRILLPDYSLTIVESFVKYLYSGEALISLENQKEFNSLCKEMMIPIPLPVNSINDESLNEPEEESIIETVEENTDEETTDESKFAEAEELVDDVEIIEVMDDEGSSSAIITRNKEMQDSKSFMASPHDIRHKSSNPNKLETTVQQAIAAIRQGGNLMSIARKFGIPKSTVYRWKKKMESETIN